MRSLLPFVLSVMTSVTIPMENKEQRTLPPMEDATRVATTVLAALQKNDPAGAHSAFFPEDEFLVLKDIKDPGGYFKELIKSYDRDLIKMSEFLKDYEELTFTSFKRGSCKWKEIGSQYNKIAYWSCYRSKFYAANDKEKVEIEIHTLINWGDKWFVTHLGRDIKSSTPPKLAGKNVGAISEHCDIPGNDLESEAMATPESCQARCAGNERCQAMTFISGWNRCILKSKLSRKVNLTMRGGTLDGGRKVTLLPADIDLSGKDIKHVSPVKTVEACGEACVENTDCQAFIFMDGYGDCWLKKEAGRQKPKIFHCWQKGT